MEENKIETSLEKVAQEEVAKKSPKELLDDFLGEEKNREMLAATAKGLDERFRSNWFDLGQVVKKTKWKNVNDALQILNLLKLANYLTAEVRNGVEKYKITLTKEGKLLLLKERKQRLLKEIEEIDKEISET